jgi:hypothetical protein
MLYMLGECYLSICLKDINQFLKKKSKAWHDICLARLLRAAQAPTSWLWFEYGSRYSIVNIVETNYGLL